MGWDWVECIIHMSSYKRVLTKYIHKTIFGTSFDSFIIFKYLTEVSDVFIFNAFWLGIWYVCV